MTEQVEDSVSFSAFLSVNDITSQNVSRKPQELPEFRNQSVGDLKQTNGSSNKLSKSGGYDGFEFENRIAFVREGAAVCPADLLFKNGRLLPLRTPYASAKDCRFEKFSSSFPETARAFNKGRISENLFREQGRSSSTNSAESGRLYWSSSGSNSMKTSCSSSGRSVDSRLNRTELHTFQLADSHEQQQHLQEPPEKPARRLAATATPVQAQMVAVEQKEKAPNGSPSRSASQLTWKVVSLQPSNPSHTGTEDSGQRRCSRAGGSPTSVMTPERGGSQINNCERRSAMEVPRSPPSGAKEMQSRGGTAFNEGKAMSKEQKQRQEGRAGVRTFCELQMQGQRQELNGGRNEATAGTKAMEKKQSISNMKCKPLMWLQSCKSKDSLRTTDSTVRRTAP